MEDITSSLANAPPNGYEFGDNYEGYDSQHCPREGDEASRQGQSSPSGPFTAKCRKIDKDGFVTPLTPDQAAPSSYSKSLDENSDVGAKSTNGHLKDGEISQGVQPQQPMDQLITELSQESQMLHSRWLETFRGSENFELFCVTRLDKLLEEAGAMERTLLDEKEQLKQRLHVLSRTLD